VKVQYSPGEGNCCGARRGQKGGTDLSRDMPGRLKSARAPTRKQDSTETAGYVNPTSGGEGGRRGPILHLVSDLGGASSAAEKG